MGSNFKIINSYFRSSCSGIGDFLRGSIYLFDICKKNNLKFGLSLIHHPISNFLIFNEYEDHEECDVNSIPVEHSNTKKVTGLDEYSKEYIDSTVKILKASKSANKYIFSNFHDCLFSDRLHLINKINSLSVDSDFCKWFKKNLFFHEDLECMFNNKLKDFNIKKDFHIFHFRLGDISCFTDSGDFENHFSPGWSPDFDFCLNYCTAQLDQDNKTPIIVISDSNKLKSYIKSKAKELSLPIFTCHEESSHTQEDTGQILNTSSNSYFYTALDIKFITRAKSVKCFSVYYWGSGFSSWVSKIYGVPFSCKPLIKPLNLKT